MKRLDAVSNGRGKVTGRRNRISGSALDAVGAAAGKATVAKSATVDVWDRVASLRPAQPEIPEGAFTLKEYMTRFQISMGAARRELARLADSGALATAIGKNTTGCVGHPERMYWLI
jgi:response regulator of citrate/malate metabolism